MIAQRPDRLDVYYGDALVGFVHDTEPLAFEYAPAWLSGPERMALAAVPRQAGRQATREVQAFFENLLPEGELPDYRWPGNWECNRDSSRTRRVRWQSASR